jgi:hypothetical protein
MIKFQQIGNFNMGYQISYYQIEYDTRLDILFNYFKKYKPILYKHINIENSHNCKKGFGLYLSISNNILELNSYGIPYRFESTEIIKLKYSYKTRKQKRNAIKHLENIVGLYYE